ncbi:MAG: hypothetical protein LUI60_07675 [Clostridia bacterium]|nr:hypothetical protein [Clostridia bacterium]
MKISEIFGKMLVNTDGKVCGYVRGAFASGEKIVHLACADGEEREFDVDFRDVTVTGDRIVFCDRRKLKQKSACVRLGLRAYTEDGKFAGYLKDVSTQNGEITHYLIGGKKYPPSALNIGDVIVIRERRVLKEDVIKDSMVLLKKGTELDEQSLKTAQAAGEYVQAQLKSI